MKYDLTRESLAKCLNRLKISSVSNEQVLKDEEFLFFHKHRNFFNNKYYKDVNIIPNVTNYKLELQNGGGYKDNLNRTWKELTYGNAYHHPYGEKERPYRGIKDYPEHLYDLWVRQPKERFSRKFISRDEFSIEAGYPEGCEFELIIHRSGYRLKSDQYMETYNFGSSTFWSSIGKGLHKKFDINPHEILKIDSYDTSHYKTHKISIIE